jgi:hypothetical protein
MTFTIISQPYLDTYNKNYINILTVNVLPQGPLSQFVRRIQFPQLSPYQQNNYRNDCCLALIKMCYTYSGNNLMTPNELPDLFSFLTSNGYQIETQLTNLMNQSDVKISDNRHIVCAATYYGNNQPNIVYMK